MRGESTGLGTIRDDDELLDRLGRRESGDPDGLPGLLRAWTDDIDAAAAAGAGDPFPWMHRRQDTDRVESLAADRPEEPGERHPRPVRAVRVRGSRAAAIAGALVITMSGGGMAAALSSPPVSLPLPGILSVLPAATSAPTDDARYEQVIEAYVREAASQGRYDDAQALVSVLAAHGQSIGDPLMTQKAGVLSQALSQAKASARTSPTAMPSASSPPDGTTAPGATGGPTPTAPSGPTGGPTPTAPSGPTAGPAPSVTQSPPAVPPPAGPTPTAVPPPAGPTPTAEPPPPGPTPTAEPPSPAPTAEPPPPGPTPTAEPPRPTSRPPADTAPGPRPDTPAPSEPTADNARPASTPPSSRGAGGGSPTEPGRTTPTTTDEPARGASASRPTVGVLPPAPDAGEQDRGGTPPQRGAGGAADLPTADGDSPAGAS